MATQTIPVSKTLAECRALVFGRVAEVQAEYAAKGWLPTQLNLNAGGVARGILEIFAWILYAFYQVLAQILPNAFPLSASGAWLDLHSGQVELTRRAATKAQGVVWFIRDAQTTGNVRIPTGRVARTKADAKGDVYRYVTLADAVLLAGEERVAVLCEAEDYGAGANAVAGQICELSTHVPGVSGVTNDADWLTSEGADEETDAQLQERYTLAWLEEAGCTSAAYKAWALSVPGVVSAKVLDDHPRGEGTVDVVVRGSAGIPTDRLLALVRAAVAAKAPVNDLWEVKAPQEVPVPVVLVLEIVSGSPETAIALGEARIRALFAGSGVEDADTVPFGIGDDFVRDRVVATLMGGAAALPGLKRVIWTSPGESVVTVPDDGLATLESISVAADSEVVQ